MFSHVLHHRQYRYLGALYLHTLVRNFAISLFQIFSSIYIFQSLQKFGLSTPQSLSLTVFFFSLFYLMQAISIVPTVWLIIRKGVRFTMTFGSALLVVFFTLFYLSGFDPIFFIISAIIGGFQTGIYWTARNVYFAEITDDKRQGKELSFGMAISGLVSTGGPAFGGLLLVYFGYGAMFLVMAVLLMIAMVPLASLPKGKNQVTFNLQTLIIMLTPKREPMSLLSFSATGIVGSISGDLWPLFIFPIMAGYVGVGLVGSINTLFASFSVILIGFLIDRFGAKVLLRISAFADALVWASAIFATLPMHIFAISTALGLTANGHDMSQDSLAFERSRKEGVLELNAQREIAFSVGRFVLLSIIAILLWFGMPLYGMFIIAAAVTLFIQFYPENASDEVVVKPV
jgi:MFS family permease